MLSFPVDLALGVALPVHSHMALNYVRSPPLPTSPAHHTHSQSNVCGCPNSTVRLVRLTLSLATNLRWGRRGFDAQVISDYAPKISKNPAFSSATPSHVGLKCLGSRTHARVSPPCRPRDGERTAVWISLSLLASLKITEVWMGLSACGCAAGLRLATLGMTVVTVLGLTKLNLAGDGISETVKSLWRPKKEVPEES